MDRFKEAYRLCPFANVDDEIDWIPSSNADVSRKDPELRMSRGNIFRVRILLRIVVELRAVEDTRQLCTKCHDGPASTKLL